VRKTYSAAVPSGRVAQERIADKRDMDLIIGIVLVLLGVLIATGPLSLGALVLVAAVLAVVVGILILAKQLQGAQNVGVALVVAGALVLVSGFLADIVTVIVNVVVGVVLVIAGVYKIQHKW
jgi:hypothetical protein